MGDFALEVEAPQPLEGGDESAHILALKFLQKINSYKGKYKNQVESKIKGKIAGTLVSLFRGLGGFNLECKNYILLLSCFCLLFSCGKNDGKKNIKDFYYPVDKMDQGIVYEYHPIGNDSLPNEYWFLRNLKTDTATYIAGQYYDHNFTIRQFFSAEIVSNGVLMNDYSIYEFDSLGYQIKRPAQILNGNSFPFEVKDSTGVFLFKLRWNDPNTKDAYVELTRNRRYRGEAEYFFQNKKKECVEFIVKELVDDYNNGHLEQQYNGKELYAKDLGLIYYRKDVGEEFVLEYELVDTFSMHELEKRYNGER